jgi:hypothetical protein
MDRLMCRTDVVAECVSTIDLEVARFNGRIVLEIDQNCPNEIIFEKIEAKLNLARAVKPRHINPSAWIDHRILALYDLKLCGYNLSKERKQLAIWLFPNIIDQKARGDKYDRARELLDDALSQLDLIRAQSDK